MDKQANSRIRFKSCVLFWAALSIGIASYAAFLIHPTANGFGPDSWSYHDLAQTVFDDFYHPAITRSYHEISGYSRSFPPLWPITLAVAERIVPAGPQLAVALAALAALLILLPLRALALVAFGHRLVATMAASGAWLGLLWFPAFWADTRAGGAIPLAILLLIAGAASAARGSFVLAGTWLGLACLTRFDSAIVCALIIIGCLLDRTRRIGRKIALLAAFFCAVLPWVAYSQAHYGVVWTSDNAAVALAASQVYAQDYLLPTGTAITEPGRWMIRIVGNTIKLGLALSYSIAVQPLLALALAAVLTFWRRRALSGPLPWLVGSALCGLAGSALTGYVDRRYFSFFTLMLALWAIGHAMTATRKLRFAIAFALILSPVTCLEFLREEFGGGPKSRRLPEHTRRELTERNSGATLLADSFCYEIGAVTRIHTVCLPTDWDRLHAEERMEFLTRFRISHALQPEAGGYRIVPDPPPTLLIRDR